MIGKTPTNPPAHGRSMKPILSALQLLGIAIFFFGCAPTEESLPPEPPPAPPAKIRVPIRSGILDWSAYDRWLAEPPQLVQIERLDRNTARLLAKGTHLAETILTEPTAAPDSNHADAIASLKHRAPGSVATSYYDKTRKPSTTVTVRTQQSLMDTYNRRWRGITESNLDSIVTQLSRQVDRDTQLYKANSSTSSRGGAQSSANLQYIQLWATLLGEANRLLVQMNQPAEPTDRERALAEWREFQERDLPLLHRLIEQNEIARHPISPDGAYEVEGDGELLLHFSAGSATLYYPLDGSHRYRLFDNRREVITRVLDSE